MKSMFLFVDFSSIRLYTGYIHSIRSRRALFMNMSDINCFLKVLECGSFSKASEEMYISQQAVSLHIKHLEDTYGITVFERRPALKLTAQGEALRDAAREIIRSETLFINQLDVSKSDYTGELSIGLPGNRSTAFASEFVPRFSSLYPNMSVNLVERYSADLPNDLVKNTIDIALPLISKTSSKPDQTYLEVFPLEPEALYLVISDSLLKQEFPDSFPDCKKQFLSGVSLYQFAHLPLFLHPSNSKFHQELLTSIKSHGIKPFIRVKTSLTSSLVALCAMGYGIFFSPTELIKYMYQTQYSYFQSLNLFPVLEYAGARRTYLVYHKQKALTKPMREAVSIIKNMYSEHVLFDEKIQHLH